MMRRTIGIGRFIRTCHLRKIDYKKYKDNQLTGSVIEIVEGKEEEKCPLNLFYKTAGDNGEEVVTLNWDKVLSPVEIGEYCETKEVTNLNFLEVEDMELDIITDALYEYTGFLANNTNSFITFNYIEYGNLKTVHEFDLVSLSGKYIPIHTYGDLLNAIDEEIYYYLVLKNLTQEQVELLNVMEEA